MSAPLPAADLPRKLAACLSGKTRWFALRDGLALECGERLPRVEIAYRTWGRPGAGGRTVLICHALTGSADADVWWPGLIGNGGAFDPRHDYVICSNILGSCYGSTGPLSRDPVNGQRYRSRFPRISVRDMVHAQQQLIDHLGIDVIDVVVGPSLGGMQALEWALCYPQRLRAIVPIGVGGRHSAWCIGISAAQRAAIYADPDWRGGDYDDDHPPEKGMAAARMMAVCGYRSPESFESRFDRQRRADGRFEIQSYLDHQGAKINQRFDANAYVRLSQAMNDHDVARARGEYDTVLNSIAQPALVVSIRSDRLYPPEEQRYLASRLPNATYAVIESPHGHDGFLIETPALAGHIRRFLERRVPLRAQAQELQLVS